MHLPISNTYAHTQRSCLQTSNPARFTFAGLGGWCQGVTSAECDLPCREHYYPREEFKHGRAAGCHLQQPAWKCRERTVGAFKKGEGGAHKKKTALAFRAPVSCEHAAALTSPHLSHLIFSAPVQGRFSTGLQRAPTQRTSQPAVITPCKCHLGLLMQPVEYRRFGLPVITRRTHTSVAPRGGGVGGHLFIHSFGNFASSALLIGFSFLLIPLYPFKTHSVDINNN